MLRLEPRTLEKWRVKGFGPPYRRIGNQGKAKVVYRLSEVLEWLDKYRHEGS